MTNGMIFDDDIKDFAIALVILAGSVNELIRESREAIFWDTL